MLLLKIGIAHLLGDFVLQSETMVRHKEQKKIFSVYFWYHILIHASLYTLFIWDRSMWPLILSLTFAHALIDTSKLYLQTAETRLRWFVADQIFHVLSIFGLWILWTRPDLSWLSDAITSSVLNHVLAVILLTKVTSVTIQHVMSRWTGNGLQSPDASLPLAGHYIGMLERLLIYIFILAESWEAIGFLLAAKSVFRFGDLREASDRKLTEYILLGTLLSFTIAIITSLLLKG